MYDGMGIMMESDCVLTRESINPLNWSGNSLIKSSVDLMGLAAVGLTTVAVGAGAGHGGLCQVG